ncbi:hypothetical protein C8J56DRAFT_928253 [Mycena floridula]|nr:hypothetical protein C8J56DRAFT_928253 [Mycena floridula]
MNRGQDKQVPGIKHFNIMPRATSSSRSYLGDEQYAPRQKKHVCPICEKGFTTSGHLRRHSLIHSGERKYPCPFPGCEIKCSRRDNLQQHYRIHLPGSSSGKGLSTRKAIKATKREPTREPSIPLTPPPLEPAYLYGSPPNTPPALVQATLPATAQLPYQPHFYDEPSRSLTSSPDSPFDQYPTYPSHPQPYFYGIDSSSSGSSGSFSTYSVESQSFDSPQPDRHPSPISSFSRHGHQIPYIPHPYSTTDSLQHD